MLVVCLAALLAANPVQARIGQFYTVEKFLNAYLQTPYQAQTLWLTAPMRKNAEQVLGHRFPGLRLRYWQHANRTAWILEEIGKEQPITLGVVVNEDRIEHLVVLEYRETRGGEITYPFFTNQFQGVSLSKEPTKDLPPRLDQGIDGITGATLSVRAATRIATLALYFHRQTVADNSSDSQPSASVSIND